MFFSPHPAIEFLISADDLLFERMTSIAKNDFAVYHDIADGSAIRSKDENRKKSFRLYAPRPRGLRDRWKPCPRIRRGQGTGLDAQCLRTVGVAQSRRRDAIGAAVNLVQHRSLLLGQPQMVIQLTRIFQRIDLSLAIRPNAWRTPNLISASTGTIPSPRLRSVVGQEQTMACASASADISCELR